MCSEIQAEFSELSNSNLERRHPELAVYLVFAVFSPISNDTSPFWMTFETRGSNFVIPTLIESYKIASFEV